MQQSRLAYVLNRGLIPLSRIVNNVGIIILLLMMSLTVLDVFLRHLFNRPILGAYEITEFTMVVVVFLSIAYTMVQKSHVNVDLLVSNLPERTQAILAFLVNLIGLAIFIIITFQSILYAKTQWLRGITSPVLYIPVYPFILLVAFGSVLLCFLLFTNLLEHLDRVLSKIQWDGWLELILGVILTLLLTISPIWLKSFALEINPLVVGLLGVGLLVIFLLIGMPVGFAMALVGFMGMIYLSGIDSGLTMMGRVPYTTVANHTLSVIPLFILMGQFVFHAGISEDLYFSAYKWIGHFRGGLAMATIASCAAFAAVCGSSPATAATIGTIAIPEMKKYKYNPGLATGSVAAGGTLGILIPPSVAFCVIGLITEQSIGRLFIAGFIPGILLSCLFIVAIYLITRSNTMGPPGPKATLGERLESIKKVWGMVALFLLVMGGIYTGIFTPTEAAGIGAFGALLFSFGRKRLNWKNLNASLLETGNMTSMIFTIFFGAMIFGYFLTVTNLPKELEKLISSLTITPNLILSVVIFIYIILGCLMDVVAMTIITVPIVFPIIVGLGFDPIWFGVILVIVAEMGLITPPVGLNVYIIAGIAKDVPMFTIFRGIFPFFIAMVVCVIILTIFPQIAIFLPNLIKGR